MRMRTTTIAAIVLPAASLCALAGVTSAQPDRYAVAVPHGLSFGEFKGYEHWEVVAVSATETSIKAILANPAMMAAYRNGTPENGKPFPEGAQTVKIEWAKVKNPVSPYFVEVPGALKTVSFIEKDTKRFPNTHGWAYAQFAYDTTSRAFTPVGTGAECGYACHTTVASRDYIFTAYPAR